MVVDLGLLLTQKIKGEDPRPSLVVNDLLTLLTTKLVLEIQMVSMSVTETIKGEFRDSSPPLSLNDGPTSDSN